MVFTFYIDMKYAHQSYSSKTIKRRLNFFFSPFYKFIDAHDTRKEGKILASKILRYLTR